MSIVLDINDCGLRFWQDQELLLEKPGYALLEGNQYRFGEEARQQARLHPRNINHRFWWQLSTEPMQPQFGPGRHSADLVHGQLQALHKEAGNPAEIVLAVPGSMTNDQLSLLLGIIEQCDFAIVGLVDRSVCAAASLPLQIHSAHIELQLHQALVSVLELKDSHVQRADSITVPGAGWLSLLDTLSACISDSFIKQTRFDPRRKADSEQALYDQLETLLEKLLASSEADVEISGHKARVEKDQILEATENLRNRILGTIPAQTRQILLEPRLRLLPGLMQSLDTAEVLEINAIPITMQSASGQILSEPGDIRYITRLIAEQETAVDDAQAKPSESVTREEPAAIAEQNVIQDTHFQLSASDGQYLLTPVAGETLSVNGATVNAPTKLAPGDRIQLRGSPDLVVAEVSQDDGS